MDEKPHVMVLERTYPTGAEEWFCPACGRRFVMQWPPDFKRIMLEIGDETARHSGGKGGLVMSSVQVVSQERDEIPDERLKPWLDALG